jgi:hypothetical protein
MAWSPARRANAGVNGVGQPGDYATLNSNPPRDGTPDPGVERHDCRPASRGHGQDALGLQELQRLAQRHAADTQGSGDLGFDQTLARFQDPARDRVDEPVGDAVGQAFRPERLEHVRLHESCIQSS